MTERHPTLDNQARFYDERWEAAETRLNHLQVMRLAAVLEGFSVILRDGGEQGLNICDLGCGTGWLTNEIRKFGHVTGIDLSQKGIELARARWPGITFLCGDALEYRPDSRFDVVVSSEVIEHLPDQERYVRTISAILELGGYVILTCPNNRAKRACEKAGNVTQPIELWPTRTQLLSLFSREFDVLLHRTFVLDFAYSGIYRWTSAPKLLKMLRILGLAHLYDGLRETFALGLHHLLVVRKVRARKP